MTERDQMVLLRAITLWDYNVNPKTQFEKAWGVEFNERDHYHREKLERISTSGLLTWSAELSRDYQARMLRAVMERYGEEADRWVGHDGPVFEELAGSASEDPVWGCGGCGQDFPESAAAYRCPNCGSKDVGEHVEEK